MIKISDKIKKYSNYLVNSIVLIILVVILYKRVPTIYNNYVMENTKLESTPIRRLSGEEISVPNINRNKVIIFWATWCGACHYEMKKLSDMLSRGEIKPDDLIAVSLDDNKEDVIKFIEQEKYQFLVAHDSDGSLARKFKISATPTVLFVNKNSSIDWISTGISPTLEKKVKEFLKN